MKIAIGSDHGGYDLKSELIKYLKNRNYEVEDFGCYTKDSCDYPDIGFITAESVSKGEFDRGILICKSGIGMSIAANKVKGIRAALCFNTIIAEKSRKHNNVNILVLCAEYTEPRNAEQIVDTWLNTKFESGRHQRRIDKIKEYEDKRD